MSRKRLTPWTQKTERHESLRENITVWNRTLYLARGHINVRVEKDYRKKYSVRFIQYKSMKDLLGSDIGGFIKDTQREAKRLATKQLKILLEEL